MDNQVASEFIKRFRVNFRLGIELPEGCVVCNQLVGNAHKSSSGYVGLFNFKDFKDKFKNGSYSGFKNDIRGFECQTYRHGTF